MEDLFDAHCHLQDPRIAHCLDSVVQEAAASGVKHFAVNGTYPGDWGKVLELAQRYSGVVVPNFGVHPWWLGQRGEGWEARLREMLAAHPSAGVGECGLDKAARGLAAADVGTQLAVLGVHLRVARELQRPVTMHCVRAYGPLLEALRREPGGFPHGAVLHSWGGSPDATRALAAVPGVHFSLSGALGSLGAGKARAMVAEVPLDRLLVETDAPDGLPPLAAAAAAGFGAAADRGDSDHASGTACPAATAAAPRTIPPPLQLETGSKDDGSGVGGRQKQLNHPANLRLVCELVGSLADRPAEDIAAASSRNAQRLFVP